MLLLLRPSWGVFVHVRDESEGLEGGSIGVSTGAAAPLSPVPPTFTHFPQRHASVLPSGAVAFSTPVSCARAAISSLVI